MEFLKKLNTVFLSLAVLLAVGCNENAKLEDPEPQVIPECRLMKEPYGGPGPGLIYTYSADSSGGRLIRMEGAFSEQTISYDSLGRIRQIQGSSDSRHGEYFLTTFEYNEKSQPIREMDLTKSQYSAPFMEWVTELTYDNQNRLISRTTVNLANPGVVTRKTNYFYTANGGLRSEYYELNSLTNSLDLNHTIEETFDNYKTPGYGFQYFDRSRPVKHNPVTQKITWYNSGAVVKTEMSTIAYTYNAGGYPVQISRNGSSFSDHYVYECQ